MLCPSCNGSIYPVSNDFICPHCFVHLKVHGLKQLTVFLLPDNRLVGIYNAHSGRVVSFMGFVKNPPIEQQVQHRQRAVASRRMQVCLNQIGETLKTLKLERQTLLESEIVVERVLVRSFGVQQQSVQCRAQIASTYELLEKLELAYTELKRDLEEALARPLLKSDSFKHHIQQQVQRVRQLESQKESALRGLSLYSS